MTPQAKRASTQNATPSQNNHFKLLILNLPGYMNPRMPSNLPRLPTFWTRTTSLRLPRKTTNPDPTMGRMCRKETILCQIETGTATGREPCGSQTPLPPRYPCPPDQYKTLRNTAFHSLSFQRATPYFCTSCISRLRMSMLYTSWSRASRCTYSYPRKFLNLINFLCSLMCFLFVQWQF